jgi:acetyl esterase/lipase
MLLLPCSGDSAGGNLAAAVSLKLRDEAFKPANKLQVLIYPHLQSLNFQLPSMMQNANGPLLTRKRMTFYCSFYLDGNNSRAGLMLNNDHVSPKIKKMGLPFIDVSKLPSKYLIGYVKPSVDTGDENVWNDLRDRLLNPYFSPLVAGRLDNLPPAYVFSAEYDPLRDEDILYVRRLRDAGVKVQHHHSDIAFHGILALPVPLPETEAMLGDMTKFVAENL